MLDSASDTMPGMGRRKKFAEKCVAAFTAGTFEAINEVLASDEDRTDFIREAVKHEIERRRSQKQKAEE